VADMPEVMEVYRMAGDVDYLLRISIGSMAEYDDIYRRLIAAVPLKNVTSRFAMERVKSTTAYPIRAERIPKKAPRSAGERGAEGSAST
jgi:Lrp/AsnC family transcriptional regulator